MLLSSMLVGILCGGNIPWIYPYSAVNAYGFREITDVVKALCHRFFVELAAMVDVDHPCVRTHKNAGDHGMGEIPFFLLLPVAGNKDSITGQKKPVADLFTITVNDMFSAFQTEDKTVVVVDPIAASGGKSGKKDIAGNFLCGAPAICRYLERGGFHNKPPECKLK